MQTYNLNEELFLLTKTESKKCIGCKLCMAGCPMLEEFCKNPKDLLKHLEDKKCFTKDLPYSCLLCGFCESVCPKGVSFKNLFLQYRRLILKTTAGKNPKGLNLVGTRMHQGLSFSPIFCKEPVGTSKKVFFPGCSMMATTPHLVKKLFVFLNEEYENIGFWNACCGKPTNFLGDKIKFSKYILILKNYIKKNNVTEVLVACENCFAVFKEYFPNIKTTSVYSFIAQKKLPKNLLDKYEDNNLTVNIHDPCPIRYEKELHDAIRKIVLELGIKIEELKYSREKTLCCGAGGLVGQNFPNISSKHTLRRANECKFPVVTYCRECVNRLNSVDGCKTFHILDLLFSDDPKNVKSDYKVSAVSAWLNRLTFKGL